MNLKRSNLDSFNRQNFKIQSYNEIYRVGGHSEVGIVSGLTLKINQNDAGLIPYRGKNFHEPPTSLK